MKHVIALCLFLLAGPALATASNQGCKSSGNQAAGCQPTASVGNVSSGSTSTSGALAIGVNQNENTNVNSARSASSASQGQGQSQGQTQGQGQTQSAHGGAGGSAVGSVTAATSATGGSSSSTGGSSSSTADNAGNSQSVVFTSPAAPDKIEIKTVGQAPDVLSTPTAPCRIGVGASAGWIGAAFGFGLSVEDEGCTMRENARLLHNFGEKAAALKLMCNDAKVAEVLAACKQ